MDGILRARCFTDQSGLAKRGHSPSGTTTAQLTGVSRRDTLATEQQVRRIFKAASMLPGVYSVRTCAGRAGTEGLLSSVWQGAKKGLLRFRTS